MDLRGRYTNLVKFIPVNSKKHLFITIRAVSTAFRACGGFLGLTYVMIIKHSGYHMPAYQTAYFLNTNLTKNKVFCQVLQIKKQERRFEICRLWKGRDFYDNGSIL